MSSKNFPIEDLLRLYKAPNVGPATFIALIEKFGSPANVFSAPASELTEISRINNERAKKILGTDSDQFIAEQKELIVRSECTLVSYWDDEYPKRLKAIYDPPVFYFKRGDIIEEDDYSLGVVGTRGVTDYGKIMTEKIVRDLVREGVTIVSGLATGVDSVAHRTALDSGGRSIAVLGSGIDRIYPQENVGLARRLAENGAVISEFPMLTPPDRGNFPQRNRIISGLTLGTLVIEGGVKSGALITAYYAVDQNREVFALPGRADSMQSEGPHHLIKHGAKLVSSADDILKEIDSIVEKRTTPRQTELDFSLTPDEQSIMLVLSTESLHIDDIAEQAAMSTSQALATLLGLELRSLERQMPGKMFVSLV